jgi:hypothetical protein
MTNISGQITRLPQRSIPRDFKVAPFNTLPRRERRAAWRKGPMKEGINFRSSGLCVQPRLTGEVV